MAPDMGIVDMWFRRHHDDAARQAVEEARRDRPRVEEVAQRAERLAARNGFGAAILKAMEGR